MKKRVFLRKIALLIGPLSGVGSHIPQPASGRLGPFLILCGKGTSCVGYAREGVSFKHKAREVAISEGKSRIVHCCIVLCLAANGAMPLSCPNPTLSITGLRFHRLEPQCESNWSRFTESKALVDNPLLVTFPLKTSCRVTVCWEYSTPSASGVSLNSRVLFNSKQARLHVNLPIPMFQPEPWQNINL